MLLVAGAYEMLPIGAPPASADKARAMAEVFALMDYDLGLLSPQESLMLDQAGAVSLSGFKAPETVETTTLHLPGGEDVGVILFPPLAPGQNAPGPDMIQAIDQAADRLQGTVNLVAGLSSWGYFNEKNYLETTGQPVDLLLGAGPGLALSGKVAAKGRCMWVRPYSRGMTLMKIEVFEWPQTDPSFQWSLKSIRATSVPLDEKVRPDPVAASILADTPQQ